LSSVYGLSEYCFAISVTRLFLHVSVLAAGLVSYAILRKQRTWRHWEAAKAK